MAIETVARCRILLPAFKDESECFKKENHAGAKHDAQVLEYLLSNVSI